MTTRARDGAAWARELEHTADVGLEVEAPSLAALFERAALAMLALMIDLAGVEARQRAALAVEADGLEELLRDWLQAVLVRFQAGGFAACEVTIDAIDARQVRATLAGEPIDRARHRLRTEVKAATYHALAVRETPSGWTARFILDV